jgi:capsule biosynthesis phosphatase
MRICFDLDGTLCDGELSGESGTDYSECQPIPGAADILRSLRSQGHTVIIQTARGMGSTHGNVGAAQAKVAAITFEQLEAWGFEYDEIYFGKPSAELYIDDKSMTALDFWEQHWEERQWQ